MTTAKVLPFRKPVTAKAETARYVPDYTPTVGSKYDSTLTVTQVAAKVRGEIKAATKAGILPKGVKVSVRAESFSMGAALHIKVTAAPFRAQRLEWLFDRILSPHTLCEGERYTPEMADLLKTLERFALAYKSTATDVHTDYHNTNFYLHVDPSHELTSAEWDRVSTELKGA